MRPQLNRALVTLTILSGGVWACATATSGDTQETGSSGPTGTTGSTSSGGSSGTSLSSSSTVSQATSTTVGQTTTTTTTSGTTTGAPATTTGSTTGSTVATSTVATSTTSTTSTSSTTSSNSSSGCETTGITAAEPLVPTDGWVGCTTNGAGVEGAFFTFGDGISSTIMPADFAGTGNEICVSGEVGQVVDGDYSVYGAGVGFNFADEAAYNATAAGVGGVSFNITSLPAGTDTRIIFTTAAGGYCMALASAGQQTVRFSDTSLDCWEAGGAAPSESGIISVQWQVTTNADSSHAFDFCINDLAVVP